MTKHSYFRHYYVYLAQGIEVSVQMIPALPSKRKADL